MIEPTGTPVDLQATKMTQGAATRRSGPVTPSDAGADNAATDRVDIGTVTPYVGGDGSPRDGSVKGPQQVFSGNENINNSGSNNGFNATREGGSYSNLFGAKIGDTPIGNSLPSPPAAKYGSESRPDPGSENPGTPIMPIVFG